jgi:hypothetical protein
MTVKAGLVALAIAFALSAGPAFASDLDGGTVNTGLPAQIDAYDAAVAASDAAGYYKLDEPTGASAAADSSGHGRELTPTGAVAFGEPGLFAPSLAAHFDGASFLSRPGFAPADDFSMEAWFKPAAPGVVGDIMANGCTCAGFWQGSFVTYEAGHVTAYLASNVQSQTIDAGPVDPDRWHHVALVREDGVASLWVDGRRTRRTITQTPSRQDTFMIGARPDYETWRYAGRVDNAAFYGRPLTRAEVVDHWQIGIDDAPPASTEAPTVSQDDFVDGRAVGTEGRWSDHDPEPEYQWRRCDAQGGSCVPITGAEERDYVIRPADRGHTLRLTVTHENRHGRTWASSQPWGPIGRNAVAAYNETIAQDSPAAFWRLDELPGDETAVDWVGDRRLRVNGQLTLGVPGSFDGSRAVRFAGGFLEGPGFARLDNFAMEAWINPAGFNEADFYSNGCTCAGFWRGHFMALTGNSHPYAISATGLPEQAGGDHVILADGLLPIEQWHHFVLQRENGVLSLWIDGVQQRQTTSHTAGGEGGWFTSIGKRAGWEGQYFHGLIDNVAYYDHPLSETRIQDHIAAAGGDTEPPTPPVLGGELAAAAAGWLAPRAYTLHADAGDADSGVVRLDLEVDGTVVDSAEQQCDAGGCSLAHDFTFDASALDSGPHVVRVTAVDAQGNSTSEEIALRIDASGPSIELSGPLASDLSVGDGSFALHVAAADQHSGVTEVEILVDGQRRDLAQQACAAGGCSLERDFSLDTRPLSEGRHLVRVVATDQVGNRATRDLELIVDRTDPGLALSGALVDGSGFGNWLAGDSYGLRVDATDAPGSGVASVEVLVDGARTHYAEQACPAGDCPMSRDFTLDTSAYGEGFHFVSVVATDHAGRQATRSLLIALDRSDPEVTLSGSLWDRRGGTIRNGSFDLDVDASDGSGFFDARSGVRSIEILLNGNRVAFESQTCSASCGLGASYRFRASQHPNGPYEVTVIVTDLVGHTVTRSFQFTKFR